MSFNRTKFLDPSEVTVLKQYFRDVRRDTVLLRLALETGCRAQELLNLTPLDLFTETSTILIRTLKGGRDRELPIKPDLMLELKRYVPFNISYRRLEQVWRKYRPVEKKFHSLRHTFAIQLYKRTKDIKLVQLALGHRSPSNTAIYTDFLYSQEELRKILD